MDMRTFGEDLGEKWLTDLAGATTRALRSWVEALPPTTAVTAGYHFGWLDEQGRPVDRAGGKLLRPMLVYACAEVTGGGEEPGVAEAAAAAELVHAATLLHDDILDGDRFRRHRPTAWHTWGRPRAMLAGDALLAQAFHVLVARPGPRTARSVAVLAEAVTQLAEGEAMDLAFETRDDVSPDEYAAMAAAKSGSLAGAACELGALAGGGDARAVEALAAFGRHLGLAYQITDDVLGIFGDPGTTGKPAGSDLVSAKKSHPVVWALASGTAYGERLRALLAGGLDEERLPEAVGLVDAAGGREGSLRAAAEELERASAYLAGSGLVAEAVARLDHLAGFVLHRTS